MHLVKAVTPIDFVAMQDKANKADLINCTGALLTDIDRWNQQLSLLRGDNIYDVARLFWSAKGQHSSQIELNVDIPHGDSEEKAALKVSSKVETDILGPVGLRMVRTLMGRQIVSDTCIIGALVNPGTTSTKATYDVLGLPVFCEWFEKRWKEEIANTPTPYLTRVRMSGDGSLSGAEETIPALNKVKDIKVFYPNMADGPAEVWRKFAASSANVLLLIGPPGTGKSNFILHMMNTRGWDDKINLVDSDGILLSPGLADWIRDRPSGSVVITEDSDKMVMKRTDGNTVMSAILNTTSGIVQRDLKLIISTNLESLRLVDEALIRPGRCYDILQFSLLSSEQAHDVREMLELSYSHELGHERKGISLAEAINTKATDKPRKAAGVGFSAN